MSSAISLLLRRQGLFFLLICLPLQLHGERQCALLSVDSADSIDRSIAALRSDPNLLNKAKDRLREYEHGRSLKKSDPFDDALYALIGNDKKIRTFVLGVIEQDCSQKNDQLSPTAPEELQKAIGPSDAPQAASDPQTTQSTPTAATPAKPLDLSKMQSNSFSRTTEKNFLKNIVFDQKDIWTSPLRLKAQDAFWLVPAAGIVGGLIHRDVDTFQGFGVSDSRAQTLKTFSDGSVVGMGASVGGLYLLGLMKSNDHARETGILGSEALANSLAVTYALKYATRRERPLIGDGRGNFFQPGGDSFPSAHAMAAWSMAAAVAREYPGSLTKIGVYSLATAISVARVSGRQHFPSDVVVGSALGWAIGNGVYKRHHDPDLPGSDIGTFTKPKEENEVDPRASIGSPYVPLDSWVYTAFDRLTALGAIGSDMSGLKPWTRLECLRLIEEASGSELLDSDQQVSRLLDRLKAEFAPDLERVGSGRSLVQLDSVYSRVTVISGKPLTDGYHFGETIYNDDGRPYQQGFNSIAGLSGSATHGHWAFYLRGEYQHAASAPALTSLTLNAIAAQDTVPVEPSLGVAAVNRIRLLEAYASYTISNWEISFGNQSLWWGPGEQGAMMLSNNAEPIPMLRFSRVTPMILPSLLRWMGPVRVEYFTGQLAGHQFIRIHPTLTTSVLFGPSLNRQPFVSQGKLSFKPTPNLEVGFSVRDIWGGDGYPVTAITFLRTFSPRRGTLQGLPDDPGAGDTGFDFKYRVPGLRNWLTLYADSLSDDELSPIAYPRRSAFRPGIYMPRIPKLPKLDFRAEGVYTDLPNLKSTGSYYFNGRYLGGDTNAGHIIGDWIGREGSGFKVTSKYWFAPENKIEVSYRNANVNPDFLGGGRYDDFSGSIGWKIHPKVAMAISSQFERWNFPILDVTKHSNVTTSIVFTFHPGARPK
jgi:membrane-associated phospholipid phosphatase